MKLVAALLLGVFLLLGVQRTPEAQVGEALTAVSLAANAMFIGGCVHAAATKRTDASPIATSTETPATP